MKGYAVINESADSLVISYEDRRIELFDDMDCEVTYSMDGANKSRLRSALLEEGQSGTLRNMILSHFGTCLDKDSFARFCNCHGIHYESFIWLN